MYMYLAELVRVVDGDTIDVKVELGFYITQTMRLRFNNVNTPEIKGKERPKGLISKKFVHDELTAAKVIGIKTYKIGKYGRFIADIYYSKRSIIKENVFNKKYLLNDKLVKMKLGKKTAHY